MKLHGLWKRGKHYYYRFGKNPWKSTGCTREDRATEYVLVRIEEAKQEALRKAQEASAIALRKYLEPYYRWETCPHVARLRAEKKQIGQAHIKHQRALIDKYILKDAIADRNVPELRRGDLLDFRAQVLEKCGDRQANRIISALKTCLKEGYYREELERDPGAGIGNIQYEKQERGTFSREELQNLFPADGLGP